MGVEPIPPASQAGVQKPLHYGHHEGGHINAPLVLYFQSLQAEGEGIEPSRPLSSSGFQPGPVANRVALPLHIQQLDQDSNPEHLVRSEG